MFLCRNNSQKIVFVFEKCLFYFVHLIFAGIGCYFFGLFCTEIVILNVTGTSLNSEAITSVQFAYKLHFLFRL